MTRPVDPPSSGDPVDGFLAALAAHADEPAPTPSAELAARLVGVTGDEVTEPVADATGNDAPADLAAKRRRRRMAGGALAVALVTSGTGWGAAVATSPTTAVHDAFGGAANRVLHVETIPDQEPRGTRVTARKSPGRVVLAPAAPHTPATPPGSPSDNDARSDQGSAPDDGSPVAFRPSAGHQATPALGPSSTPGSEPASTPGAGPASKPGSNATTDPGDDPTDPPSADPDDPEAPPAGGGTVTPPTAAEGGSHHGGPIKKLSKKSPSTKAGSEDTGPTASHRDDGSGHGDAAPGDRHHSDD